MQNNNTKIECVSKYSSSNSKIDCQSKTDTYTSLLYNKSHSFISIFEKKDKKIYNLLKIIHKSNSNVVYLASKTTDQEKKNYVYKESLKNFKFNFNEIKNEYDVLSICNNIFIENIIDMLEDEPVIIKEYIFGTTLNEYIKFKHREKEQLYYIFYQITLGIYYLHTHNIIHRDIKAENIMITNDGIIKIIDFGFSTFNKKDNFQCGTPRYLAPGMQKYIKLYKFYS